MSNKGVPYKPQFPYSGKQIIIDSDSINLDAKADVVINAEGKIRLGIAGKDDSIKDSPLAKGDQLFALLTTMIAVLNQASIALGIAVDSDGHPVTANQIAESDLKTLVQAVSPYLTNLLSTKSFTR
jgi:hypothetical protein